MPSVCVCGVWLSFHKELLTVILNRGPGPLAPQTQWGPRPSGPSMATSLLVRFFYDVVGQSIGEIVNFRIFDKIQ